MTSDTNTIVSRRLRVGDWWFGGKADISGRIYYQLGDQRWKQEGTDRIHVDRFVCMGCCTPGPYVERSQLIRKVTDIELSALAILFPEMMMRGGNGG